MLYIDTNIFLELELKDAKWTECKNFLEKVDKNQVSASISSFHLYSVILRIENETKSESRIKKFIDGISSLSGLSIYQPAVNDWITATKTMQKEKLDFDDAMVISCMIANNIKTLVSFDSDFDKVKEIKRIEPKDVK